MGQPETNVFSYAETCTAFKNQDYFYVWCRKSLIGVHAKTLVVVNEILLYTAWQKDHALNLDSHSDAEQSKRWNVFKHEFSVTERHASLMLALI